VDAVLGEDFSDVIRNCPFDLSGKDMEGRPSTFLYTVTGAQVNMDFIMRLIFFCAVLASAMGRCQLRKIALRGKGRLDRATIYLMEKMSKIGRETQKDGENPQTGIIISDMAGLSLKEHTCLACITN